MGSACGRRSRTGLSAATAARSLTMGVGQARWPFAASGSSPPRAWPQPLCGAGCGSLPALLPALLPWFDAPAVPLPAGAAGPAPLPSPAPLLPGSAGLRCCCDRRCFGLGRGGRLKSWLGSGCGRGGARRTRGESQVGKAAATKQAAARQRWLKRQHEQAAGDRATQWHTRHQRSPGIRSQRG